MKKRTSIFTHAVGNRTTGGGGHLSPVHLSPLSTSPAIHLSFLEAILNINDIVAEQIEQARQRAAAEKRRREELAAARRRGLRARHAAKLSRQRRNQ